MLGLGSSFDWCSIRTLTIIKFNLISRFPKCFENFKVSLIKNLEQILNMLVTATKLLIIACIYDCKFTLTCAFIF